MAMSSHDHDHDDHDHDHDHDQGHAHEREWERAPERDHDAQDGRAHHLYRAAATGRTDVIGTAGMGLLQRTVGNGALGPVIQRARNGSPEQAEKERAEEEPRSPVHEVVSSGGSPIDTETRTDLENRMGADFSDVRIHNDSAAHDSAKGVGAHAYTVGNNVVFQRDAYDPSSPQGRTTLAHELTHVIQQRQGPVEGTEAPGGIRVSDPSDRFEREAVANADRVLAEPAQASAPPVAAPPVAAPTPASAAPAVQRAATEDEEEQPADVQGSFVQRAESKSPEEEDEAPA
ncbi:eCIS core domain-containing protein [Streptomyces sp. NBC_01716]|uniref:eCIS core domain-containing protein n=1 Tax=Streptomyces sp. NBC_01716 TaxID=2975917 RepID=UPI003FCE3B97